MSDTNDPIRVSESEFQRTVAAVTERALQEPVAITRDGRDHVIMVSAQEYARLKRRDRRVHLAGELPEEWVEAVRNANVPDEFSHLDSELK